MSALKLIVCDGAVDYVLTMDLKNRTEANAEQMQLVMAAWVEALNLTGLDLTLDLFEDLWEGAANKGREWYKVNAYLFDLYLTD
jgi:hypothetical protein